MYFFFFLMIRRPPRSTQSRSSAASDVYKRQASAPFDGYPANTPPDQMLYYGGFHKHTSYEQAGYSDTNSDYRQDYDSMQASGFMISTNNALGPGHSICLLYTSPSPRD